MNKFKVIFIVCTILMSSSTYGNSSNNDVKTTFIAYHLYSNNYLEFIANPSEEYLIENSLSVSEYEKFFSNIDNVLKLRKSYFIGGEKKVYTSKPEKMRIGGFNINDELVDILLNKERIEDLINEQKGVVCVIEKWALVECSVSGNWYAPLILWADTNNGMYFIHIDYDETNSSHNKLTYKVYEHETFNEKYKKRNGKLIINDNEIAENDISFYCDQVDLPLRSILESIGVKVEWNDEKREIYLDYSKFGEDTYVLPLDETSVFLKTVDKENSISSGYWPINYMIENGRLFVNEYVIKGFLYVANADISVDHDNYIVNIVVDN